MMSKQFQQLSLQAIGIEINLVGVANSRKMHFNEDGIALTNAVDSLLQHGEPSDMDIFCKRMFE